MPPEIGCNEDAMLKQPRRNHRGNNRAILRTSQSNKSQWNLSLGAESQCNRTSSFCAPVVADRMKDDLTAHLFQRRRERIQGAEHADARLVPRSIGCLP